MTQFVLEAGLHVAKAIGLFRLARRLTRNGLRIICYHGFAVAEEYRFRSKLFIRAELFERRIAFLQRNGYPILPLEKAVDALATGGLPPCATVLTSDDGWEGLYTQVFPIIQRSGVPLTTYVMTWYVEHDMPVFSVAMAYFFWASRVRSVQLPDELGTYDLATQADAAHAAAQDHGVDLPPEQRSRFIKDVAVALGIPFEEVERRRLFRLLTPEQIRALAAHGVDVELHTHRHQWSLEDRDKVVQEIEENRAILAPLTGKPLRHFCYPSGVYASHQGEWLKALGIKTATTIVPGLNCRDTSPFELKRMLDGGPVSDIEFEAEMSGFLELARSKRRGTLLATLRSLRLSNPDPAALTPPRGMGEKGQDFYDEIHAKFNSPDVQWLYRFLIEASIAEVRHRGSAAVLEVGCGNGWLAHEILSRTEARYRGFDFSGVSVGNAAARTGRADLFFVGDALTDAAYHDYDYDTVVCTEVLEHVERDLDVVAKWRTGTWCVCSVPNFDYEGHVRYFLNADQVAARYGSLIDIAHIRKIRRPLISNAGLAAYFRRLRWSRNDMGRLMGYLGILPFTNLGGWFLFSGLRR